jgi:N-acetylmuramoyl-L-alanine amidase
MGKLTYIVIHCTDTPATMKVTKAMLEEWHKGPRYNPDGTWTYLGRQYANKLLLPNDFINGKSIQKILGRGWDRLGYSDLFHRDGTIENLTPYNKDGNVDPNEMTWGVAGINSISRHIVLEGGWKGSEHSGIFPFFDVFTEGQFSALEKYLYKAIEDHPQIKIIGHYMMKNCGKTCPNTDIRKLCVMLRISKEHVGI